MRHVIWILKTRKNRAKKIKRLSFLASSKISNNLCRTTFFLRAWISLSNVENQGRGSVIGYNHRSLLLVEAHRGALPLADTSLAWNWREKLRSSVATSSVAQFSKSIYNFFYLQTYTQEGQVALCEEVTFETICDGKKMVTDSTDGRWWTWLVMMMLTKCIDELRRSVALPGATHLLFPWNQNVIRQEQKGNKLIQFQLVKKTRERLETLRR